MYMAIMLEVSTCIRLLFLSYPIGVLKYDNLTYPSTSYFDYIDVSPNPNTTEVQIINLTINEGYTLLTQPYVQLRGAQVEGDTLRHEVNLINNGGILCFCCRNDF